MIASTLCRRQHPPQVAVSAFLFAVKQQKRHMRTTSSRSGFRTGGERRYLGTQRWVASVTPNSGDARSGSRSSRRPITARTSSSAAVATDPATNLTESSETNLPLWYPQDFNMTYPKALSPSAINEFLACPQSFLFQYIYGIRQPTNLALAKGSFCHTALEQVFDLDAPDRTLDHLQNLFRKAWSQQRKGDTYRALFQKQVTDDWDLDAEVAWGKDALQLLENYVYYEDPRTVTRPNPVQREVWVKARLTLDPLQGSTGYIASAVSDDEAIHKSTSSSSNNNDNDDNGTFLVRGIVDRLDMVRDAETRAIVLRLTDYKTGKAPELKYSPSMNEQIVASNFFQLKIYALLLREKQTDLQHTMDLRFLRLLYLTSAHNGPAVAWDYDLGATALERDKALQEVHATLSRVWMEIVELVSQQDPTLWKGCDRSYCYCHKCRARFHPGTVWTPPE